jgi:hypothetical protein
MRKKLASAIVILGLLGSSMASMAPANAIFGLSKCEKVKKQILSYEKQEKALAVKWAPANGRLHSDFSLSQNRYFFELHKSIVRLEVKMFTLEKNNPKCFTITQNELITETYPSWKKWETYYKNQSTYIYLPRMYQRWSNVIWESIYDS